MSERPRRRNATAGPTLAQVAAEAGVSMTTASRVMNGGLRHVNEVAQRRVLSAADRLGYVPNGHAASVASGTTSRAVGLVVPPLSSERRAMVVSGVLRAAAEADFLLTIAESSADPAAEVRAIRALRRQRVAALIVLPGPASWSGTTPGSHLTAELAAFERAGGIARLLDAAPDVPDTLLERTARGLVAGALALLAGSAVARSTVAQAVPTGNG